MDLPLSSSIPLQHMSEHKLDPAQRQQSIIDRVNGQYPNHLDKSHAVELTDEELADKCEVLLTQKIREGDHQAFFQLGQVFFELGNYRKAKKYFDKAPANDWQAQFQLGVIYFDALGSPQPDYERGLMHMKAVASCNKPSAAHLKHSAEYNVGRAYFQGYGVRTDYLEAERWWLLSADDGNPAACIRAQSMLGMFYSRPDTLNLKQAFFWHSEACGNGNLESQGALGVMYLYGLGVKKNPESAFECLSEASQRGNVYAMGHMVAFYYMRKLFTKCVDMASRVSQLENIEEIAEETECQARYISKGICLACFYYARCLDKQLGIKNNQHQAPHYYSRSYQFDPDTCANLQNIATQGKI